MKLFAVAIVYFLIFSDFVVVVLGQIDSSCRAANRAAVPTNWRVLLDSNDYSFIFQSPSPSWLRSDVDGDGMQFTEIGGLCTRVLSVCPSNFMPTGNEDNWVFTGYTSYGSAKEIFLNVTYSYPACFGNCHPYVTLYRYDTSVPVPPAGRITTSNYQLLTGSETTSRFGSASASPMIQETGVSRSSGFAGFYLGIRDTGTCGFPVQRVIIHYKVCEAKTGELVTFPEEALPLESAGSGVYSGSCVPNAHAVTSLMVDVNSVTGSCTERATGGARCECDAGYYRVNGTLCEACGVNQYRASTQSQTSCRSCPLKSEARVEGSAICQCLAGYYRNDRPQEGPEMQCTQPPGGPVGNLVSTTTTSDSVTISWDRPSSLGRRTDYYYSIEHSDPRGSASSTITANSRLKDTNSRVTYTVSNLLPSETYNIRVMAHNGVSDQEPSTACSRTRAVDATTSEAAPGPVMVTALCSAIVWQAPAMPNGVITRYEVDLGGAVTPLPADRFFIETSEEQQNSNVAARVRAVNGAGPGLWTLISGICPGTTPKPEDTPQTPTQEFVERTVTTQQMEPVTEPVEDGTTPKPEDTPQTPTQEFVEKTVTTQQMQPVTEPVEDDCYFILNGARLRNNSAIALDKVGEDEGGLCCVCEDNPFCCNRVGEVFYPNNTKVLINIKGHGMWRNRKGSSVCLHRRTASAPAYGNYRCEIPSGNHNRNLYITLASQGSIGMQVLESGGSGCPKNATTASSCLIPGTIAAGASFLATTVMGLTIAAFCLIRYRMNKKLDSEMRKTENMRKECAPQVHSERQNGSMGLQMEKKI